jgi:dihydropyrimidine dehydrogenase (NAD+) subunit PreA
MVEAESRSEITLTPVAKVDQQKVPHGRTPLQRIPRVDEAECVGCNLCALVCPVAGCITMEQVETGLPVESWEMRTAGGRG